MVFERACGILVHPTSFPGRFGIGSLGAEGRRFLDQLREAGQSLWQICPLGPTGFGDSPYQCFSAFAGNPLLIDVEQLVAWGLTSRKELDRAPEFSPFQVEYGRVIEWKNAMLQKAFERFSGGEAAFLREAFQRFCLENASWLDDFAFFMALKEAHRGDQWTAWPPSLVRRDTTAMEKWGDKLQAAIERRRFDQFLFFTQWNGLKTYANERGICIIGDVPIFVAHDSADVWANPGLFHLDGQGEPTVVAGVPPDYFSSTGQRWGNPLYRWDVLEKSGFAWWIERFRTVLHLVDIVRVDHFRGFEAYWEVPAEESTALNGKWVKAPGEKLFKALRSALGELPIIAEDLGVITDEVTALRKAFGFPGMKVLQFAFGDEADHEYLPHNHEPDAVVYTGTHDNDTTLGWYRNTDEKIRDRVRRYLWCNGKQVNWDFIRAAYMSVARTAMVPLQDALSLGTEGRLNFPGKPQGNWEWRFLDGALTPDVGGRLRELAETYDRIPEISKERKRRKEAEKQKEKEKTS